MSKHDQAGRSLIGSHGRWRADIKQPVGKCSGRKWSESRGFTDINQGDGGHWHWMCARCGLLDLKNYATEAEANAACDKHQKRCR